MLDPGIGFGKTIAHNLELLERLGRADRARAPAASSAPRARASSGASSPTPPARPSRSAPSRRLPGTIATNVLALERGASVFRVHDVAPVRDALAVAAATLGGRWTARAGTTQTS